MKVKVFGYFAAVWIWIYMVNLDNLDIYGSFIFIWHTVEKIFAIVTRGQCKRSYSKFGKINFIH